MGGLKWVILHGMRDAILAQNVYYAKPNPEPDTHSGSFIFKGLGDQALQSTLEYYLATVIVTRLLTQPITCKIGSSSFEAMI